MSKQYNSSIIIKYGDITNVSKDVKALKDILDRQGSSLLIDVIAENIGQANLLHNFSDKEKSNILNSILAELKDAILERI